MGEVPLQRRYASSFALDAVRPWFSWCGGEGAADTSGTMSPNCKGTSLIRNVRPTRTTL